MLYDPKWETKVKPDTFSLAGLVAWLETKDPAQSYNWFDVNACVLCQYLRETTGVERPAEHTWPGGKGGFGGDTLGPNWGYGHICSTHPWTFGAALERARALL